MGTKKFKRICVFCGSRRGINPAYAAATRALGKCMAAAGIGLVYGGGNIGLMGLLADSVLAHGGESIGVIPQSLMRREVGHAGLSELIVVGSMHERKAQMAALADAFIALPGGLGTLEELFEIWTWAQLGVHRKPCGLLNVERYYDTLLAFLAHTVNENFVDATARNLLLVESDAEKLLGRLQSYKPPDIPQWVDEQNS